MAHRERLMTTEDVLEELELGDENDDLDEPMMPGSDDEFSDCDLDENEDDDDANNDDITGVPTTSQPQQVNSGASSTPFPPQWSYLLNSVSISDFMSPVGPTVAIPESPSEVFELMFTPSLMNAIVEQTNRYARGDGR